MDFHELRYLIFFFCFQNIYDVSENNIILGTVKIVTHCFYSWHHILHLNGSLKIHTSFGKTVFFICSTGRRIGRELQDSKPIKTIVCLIKINSHVAH